MRPVLSGQHWPRGGVEIVAWCRSSCKGVCPNPAAMTPVLDTRPKGAVQEGGGQKHRKAPILPCVIFFCRFSQCSTIPCQSLVGHLRCGHQSFGSSLSRENISELRQGSNTAITTQEQRDGWTLKNNVMGCQAELREEK